MRLSRIKGQERAVGLLASASEASRLPHAYLFHGPDGVGKETTAVELAKHLNCEAGEDASCGKCRACRMADGLSHPDIHMIFPVPRDLKAEARAEIIAGYLRDGYRDEGFGRKTAIISVETVLSGVVVKANQRPYVGPWKVFILADADRMTTEAANTLLKTLEEPPDMTVIILTTSRPSALPATVVSRCQKVPFSQLAPAAVEGILLSDPRLGFDSKGAKAAAALARGSAGRAVRTDKEGLEAELDRVAAIVQGTRVRDVKTLVDEANTLAFRLGRHEQQKLLDLMLLWFRDVLVLSQSDESIEPPDILYARHRKALESHARGMDFATIGRLIEKIDEARTAIERYSNPTIVFTSVLLDMAVARKRAGATRGAGYAA
jgi:DNA polymerase-3 subunit delta'